MKGFTLIETVLGTAIVLILALISLPIYRYTFEDKLLKLEAQKIQNLLRKAQSRAMNGEEGLPWGVYFTPFSYTLFKGSAFKPEGADENFQLRNSRLRSEIKPSPEWVIFQRISGIPLGYGGLFLSSKDDLSPRYQIVINREGIVDVYAR
ncbi:MAG: type II secretion system protein [Parcubacteria group bacterium]|nr:type II secretion system protein [Parcubacteria group bacterium]